MDEKIAVQHHDAARLRLIGHAARAIEQQAASGRESSAVIVKRAIRFFITVLVEWGTT